MNVRSLAVASSKMGAPARSGVSEKNSKEEHGEETSVKISYLPQDPGMIGVKHGQLEGSHGEGPQGQRFRISEPRDFPLAQPTEKGNFLYRLDDPRFDAANSYYVANKTLAMAESYLGRTIPWSFSKELGRDQLLIRPHSGEMANAFYSADAGSLNFYHYADADGVIERTASHTDVVAHETGHAILDAVRPLYIHSLSVPAGGFHESFGDMMAILNALNDEHVVDQLWRDTRGDLAQSNLVSRVAENLGKSDTTEALRDAANDYKYADQHFLPYFDQENPNGAMGQEGHAYSNLFTGAFYELFRKLYESASESGDKSFKESVSIARDQAGRLLLRSLEFSPVGDPSYRDVALAFFKADQIDNGGAARETLEEVFLGRKIVTPEDLEAFDARELPQIRLRKSAMEKEGAARFLGEHRQELGLPEGVEFEFLSSHENRAGERHIQFKTHRDAMLDEPDFGMHEGSKLRAEGGLHLAFDAGGKLIASDYDEVTDRELQDIKDHLKVAIAQERLASREDSEGKADLRNPMLLVDVFTDGGSRVLQRSSIIYG